MPKQDTATTKAETKKRTVLTPAQRAAKLQAEAKALLEREAEKAKAKIKGQEERVAQLQSQVDDRQAKLDAAKAELEQLKVAAGVSTEDPSTDES